MADEMPTAQAALERFVVENDDLLDLEARIGRFNIFDALGIARAEIRHSNFLRFLLDPNESHGQGDVFLRAVLMDLLKHAAPELRPLSPVEVDGAELRGVEVFRERDRIDLEIVCREPAFVIAIENKVDAGEHGDQLARYGESIRRRHQGAATMFVFLTPDGEDPSDANWIPYSYQSLHKTLARARAANVRSIGDDVLAFLDHYLNLIGTRFMNDPAIDALCERIYQNHRQALELIFDRVGRPGSGTSRTVEASIRADDRWHVFYRTGAIIDFVPRSWIEWLPKIGLDRKSQPESWFVLRFELYPKSLDYYVQVGPIADAALRHRVITAMLADSVEFGFKQRQGNAIKTVYTRVSGRRHFIAWPEGQPASDEKIAAAVTAELNRIWQHVPALTSAFRAALSMRVDSSTQAANSEEKDDAMPAQ